MTRLGSRGVKARRGDIQRSRGEAVVAGSFSRRAALLTRAVGLCVGNEWPRRADSSHSPSAKQQAGFDPYEPLATTPADHRSGQEADVPYMPIETHANLPSNAFGLFCQSAAAGSWHSCALSRSKSTGLVMNLKAPSWPARRRRSSPP